MKKISAILLALVMLLSMFALAEEPADGTITIQNAMIGHTYNIYKVFDAHWNTTTETVSYTVKATMKEAIDDLIEAGNTVPFAIADTANSDGDYAVTQTGSDEEVFAWLSANVDLFGDAVATVVADATTETVVVDFGYYYITTSNLSAVTVTTNTPHVEVIDKNTTEPGNPSDGAVKEIVIPEDNKVTTTEAQIGDVVAFEVEFTTTNYIVAEDAETIDDVTPVTQYTIVDTPTDLVIDEDSIVVTVNGAEPLVACDVTVENNVMTIVMPWVNEENEHVYADPSTVKITYTATVVATDGEAENDVDITYNEDEPVADGETTVTTHEFTLKKVDKNNTELFGAEFELYDAEGNQVPVVACDASGNVIEPDDEETEIAYYRVALENEQGKAVVIKVGTAVIKGLDAATYELKEIKAPEGYNMLLENESIVVTADNTAELAVVNNAGSELPSTGGIGTTIFYVVGGLMMAAAVVLLVAKKKVAA